MAWAIIALHLNETKNRKFSAKTGPQVLSTLVHVKPPSGWEGLFIQVIQVHCQVNFSGP